MYVYIYIYTHVYTYIYIYNIGLRVEGRVSALGLGVRMEGSGWRVSGYGAAGLLRIMGGPRFRVDCFEGSSCKDPV